MSVKKMSIDTSSINTIKTSYAKEAAGWTCGGNSCSTDCPFGGAGFSCGATTTFRVDTTRILLYLTAHRDRWEEK